jgi:hypothetical protein
MRIVLCAVALLVTASVADAQIVRRGTLRPADAALFAAQGGAGARHWFVDAQAPSGAVTRLVGDVALRGATTEERTADFLARWGSLFDAGAVELTTPRVLHTGRTTGNAYVRLEQMVHGLQVIGAGLTLEITPDGRALCVHGIVSAAAAALPAPTISTAQAIAVADAELGARGQPVSGWQNGPHLIGGFVDPLGRAGRPFWRIGAVPRAGVPLAVDVDALDGTVLAVFENVMSFGEGALAQDGNFVFFKTGNGKGVVYKDFKAAATNSPSFIALPELAKETAVAGLAEDGTLYGRFALVLNQTNPKDDSDLFTIPGVNHQFLGSPFADNFPTLDLFDATNCYYHITKFALGMTKIAGGQLATDFSMPTLVNSPFAPVNAFFSTDDPYPFLGTGPGFMLYGDNSWFTSEKTPFEPQDDVARDPTVMCHEYTHGICAFSGLDFGGDPPDSPSRAVNEALADYFAGSFFKDPRIGFPMAQLGSDFLNEAFGMTPDGLRNMAERRTFIDNIDDFLDEGFPEEHVAGQIFGCTLWHFREVMKQKVADDVIFDSIFNWPEGLGELGYTEYTTLNAHQAYVDYYAACLATLVNDTGAKKGFKNALKALGACMQNGALGCIETDSGMIFDGTSGGSLTLRSSFLGTSDGHLVALALAAGQTLDITLTGDKKDGTLVDLSYDGPAELTFPNEPVVTANGIKAKGVQVNTSGNYAIFILNDGAKDTTPRDYTLKIKVKG